MILTPAFRPSAFLIVIAVLTVFSTSTTGATFYNIGTLPTANPFPQSFADGLSPDGGTAVGRADGAGIGWDPAKWTIAGGLSSLGHDPAFIGGTARDASLGGTHVAGYRQLTGNLHYRGFRHVNGAYTDLGDLPGGTDNTVALGISWDGKTITGLGNFNDGIHGDEGFIWQEGVGIRGIGFLPGTVGSQALAISGDGRTIVGGVSDNVGFGPAVRWTEAGGMVSLGALPGQPTNGGANDVNVDGSVIVGTSQSGQTLKAFRWTSATNAMQDLGDLPGGGVRSVAEAVTDDGNIVVGYSTTGIATGVGEEAFIFDDVHGMRNLRTVLVNEYGINLTGWVLDRANAISTDGTVIAGSGYDPAGNNRGWVVVIPEPSTACVAISATLVVASASRRRLRSRK